MSNSKLKSINKAALWEQWIGKAAYVSDKYPANNWQACEILDVVESGLLPTPVPPHTHVTALSMPFKLLPCVMPC